MPAPEFVLVGRGADGHESGLVLYAAERRKGVAVGTRERSPARLWSCVRVIVAPAVASSLPSGRP
jgi:hypothetical protein